MTQKTPDLNQVARTKLVSATTPHGRRSALGWQDTRILGSVNSQRTRDEVKCTHTKEHSSTYYYYLINLFSTTHPYLH